MSGPTGHQGAESVRSDHVETTPTATDLLEAINASKTNERRFISILNLLLNLALARFTAQTKTASGAIDLDTVTYVELNKSDGALAMTIAAPKAGHLLVITQIDSGTQGHTVTLTAGTYDGTNDIATFNAQYETLALWGVSADRFVILENIGAVGLSAS